MTISEDFITTQEGEFEPPAPNYPVVFGVTLTPAVSGVLIGVLGLAGSLYLLLNLALPTWQKYQELEASRNEKQAQVQQKQATVNQSEQVQIELAKAKQQQAEVLALFANEKTLDTLLLDLNRVVESVNAQIPANNVRAKLKRFVPVNQSPELITDGSLGSQVNNKLKRQTVTVEIEGTFEQTQSIIRNIERLQPLLLIKDYQSSAVQRASNQAGITVVRGPQIITTSFQLQALIPASPEEAAQAAAANQPPK